MASTPALRRLVDYEYILCSKDTYFRYVMLYKPVHSLGAYRTMTYYQLDTIVANRLENDYNRIIQSQDYEETERIADKYGIKAAVFSGPERSLPVYKALISRWPAVWWNEHFIILSRNDRLKTNHESERPTTQELVPQG